MNVYEWLDRFCESRHRWLIVTGCTIVAAIVTVLPQVDQYLTLSADENQQVQLLEESQRTAEELPRFRTRVDETLGQLGKLEDRMLTEAAVADFRNHLIEIVRESGCQMRRLGVGNVQSRPWHADDDPIDTKTKNKSPQTSFTLEIRPVNLLVTGSTIEVRALLSRVESDGMVVHARNLDLRPAGGNRSVVQLDLELWYFSLERGARKA